MQNVSVVALGLICVMSACSDADAPNQAVVAETRSSPVGIWQLRYDDAVGQPYLNVLEFRPDGTYTTHMQDATPSDAGQYSFNDSVITFDSGLNPQFSRDVPYQLENGDTLRLMVAGSQATPVYVDWKRSSLSRTMETTIMSRQRVPSGLPQSAVVLAEVARAWQPDAVPTWIRTESEPHGEFELSLHYYSPNSRQEMRLNFSPYRAWITQHDGERTLKSPLPTAFLDLPVVLNSLNSQQGAVVALSRAELKVLGTHGAVWQLVNDNGQASYISATSGKVLSGDLTGYVDQYNADWEQANKLWRDAMAQYLPNTERASCPDTLNEYTCILHPGIDCVWLEPSETDSRGSCITAPWEW